MLYFTLIIGVKSPFMQKVQNQHSSYLSNQLGENTNTNSFPQFSPFSRLNMANIKVNYFRQQTFLSKSF